MAFGPTSGTTESLLEAVEQAVGAVHEIEEVRRPYKGERDGARAIASLRAYLEELDAMRPDLDGTEIMRILGVGPGPVVGKAYRFLLERRLDRGPAPAAVAESELREWWAAEQS